MNSIDSHVENAVVFGKSISLEKPNRIFDSRIAILLATAIYIASLIYFLKTCVSVEWREYKFIYGSISLWDCILLVVSVTITASAIPLKVNSPSTLMLLVVHVFIYSPALAVIAGLDTLDGEKEFQGMALMLTITVGFACANFLARTSKWSDGDRLPSKMLTQFIIIFWLLGLVLLVVKYRSIMSFAGLDSVYAQREIGAAKGRLDGYLQTYFGYVFSPALLAIGLSQKRHFLSLMGILGGIVVYMITAEKAVLTYPFFMISLFWALGSRFTFVKSTSCITLLFTILIFGASIFYEDSYVAKFVAWYVGVRSLITPGSFIVFYSDYFSQVGFTYWSNITGLSIFIEAPMHYAAHRRWPSLGHIIGEDYIGIRNLNANANFIASDGVACFGLPGIFIVLILFAYFVRYLDRLSSGISQRYLLTALVPLSLTLTNASIFTTMSSFGGFAILLALFYGHRARPENEEETDA